MTVAVFHNNDYFDSIDITQINGQRIGSDIHVTKLYTDNHNIYLGTTDGMYVSTDMTGQHWSHVTTENGLAGNVINDIYGAFGNIYVATNNGLSIKGGILSLIS